MSIHHRRTCPTCGQPLAHSTVSDEEINAKRRFAVFKDFHFDVLTLDTLKGQLDVMHDNDREYLLDVMLRIMESIGSRSVILEKELPRIVVLYNKYCKTR